MSKIKIVGYRVLVEKEKVEDEEVRESGVVVPKLNMKLERFRTNRGVVKQVGDIAYRAFSNDYTGEAWCKVGDVVVWAEYADKQIEDPETGEVYSVVNDEDIIAVFEKDD